MIAAPFYGEFGWEVALWAPWLRGQRNKFNRGRDCIVFCRPGHEALYADFATTIYPLELPGIVKIDCQLVWVEGFGKLDRDAYSAIVKEEMEKLRFERPLVSKFFQTPLDMRYTWDAEGPPIPHKQSEFRRLSKRDQVDDRLIVLHARSCKKQPERNWKPVKWCDLREQLEGNIASIGTKDEALHVSGTEDMRGITLEEDIKIIGSSRVVIGPSSGPLHLANHCGTPVVWWSPNAKEVSRYATAWNPFKVQNRCAARTWDPDPDEVAACLTTHF